MPYAFTPADPLSVNLFFLFSLFMLALVLFVFKQSDVSKRAVLGLMIYLGVFSAVVYLKLPETHFIPVIPILFLSVLLGATYISFSKIGMQIGQQFSLSFLIGLQAFRLPLELILHHWANVKTIPDTMTWSGQNWDVLSGIISLVAIPLVNKNIQLAWTVQIIGFGLLLNVLRVVIMSSSLPFSWGLENPLLLIMELPYAYIGPLFVGVALAFHLIVFRKLIRMSL